MKYQEIIPIKPLQQYIRYFWVLEHFKDTSEIQHFKIIPDGIPALIFHDKPGVFVDEENRVTPQLYVYGQFTKPTNQSVSDSFRIIGAYLQPTALKAIFKIDANEFRNQNILLQDIVSGPILEQLINAASVHQKIQLLSDFLLVELNKGRCDTNKATFATAMLQNNKTLNEIQSQMNMSERTLERLLNQHIGMPPKLFSRILRFQSGLNVLRNANFNSLTELSYQNGYFDQSHFIREFREFTGTNPRDFLIKAEEQLMNFPEWKKDAR